MYFPKHLMYKRESEDLRREHVVTQNPRKKGSLFNILREKNTSSLVLMSPLTCQSFMFTVTIHFFYPKSTKVCFVCYVQSPILTIKYIKNSTNCLCFNSRQQIKIGLQCVWRKTGLKRLNLVPINAHNRPLRKVNDDRSRYSSRSVLHYDPKTLF